jgi:TonB-linked SusC/RagA family outer membrane protein
MSYTSPLYTTRHKVSPSDPIYNEDGTWNEDLLDNGDRNPALAAAYNTRKQSLDRSFNTIFANITFMKGLVLNTTLSRDFNSVRYNSWTDPRTSDGDDTQGDSYSSNYQYIQNVWKNNLTYEHQFGQQHHFDALIGYETNEYQRNYLSGETQEFPTVDQHAISNGGKVVGASGYQGTGWRLLSYLGRANYNYANRYYLGASARIDGSSRLAASHRWGTFWSVSGAWRFSSEKFWDSLSPVINDGKLRVSYGTNGTLPSDYYGYMPLVSYGYNYLGMPGSLESQLASKKLSWEKNRNLNIGIDLRFLDRISATVEWYNRNTVDLLMDVPISYTTGFGTQLGNMGYLRNRGVELDLSADIFKGGKFTWTSSINLSHNANKLLRLDGEETQVISSPFIHEIGKPYYQFYVKEFAGVNPDDGHPLYYVNGSNGTDASGKRLTTEDYDDANYIAYKSPNPNLVGGWTNTLRYAGFDLNFNFNFSLGGYSYDNAAQKLDEGAKEDGAMPSYYSRAWKKPGDVTDIEMLLVGSSLGMDEVVNSRRVHSTDFLRLKALTFGYTLPQRLTKRAFLNNVRVYFSASNLLTWAAYKQYDPETAANGEVSFESPKMKTATLGIDIKF